MVFISCAVGCGTENPICTDSFCLVPRDDVTGEVIELDNAKVLALIDSLAVETPEAVDSGTLAEIVSDTAAGGTAYHQRFVTVSAVIEENFTITGTSDGLTLETGNESVTFFVSSYGTRERSQGYLIGETYDLTLFITEQSPDTHNNDGSFNVWSHLALHGDTPQVVLAETLLADARSGNQRHQGRVVTLTDEVHLNTPESTGMYFATSGLYAIKSGHPDEAEMTPGQTVTVDAFIVSIGKNRFTSLLEIRAYLIRD